MRATGVGSLPGSSDPDGREYTEATRTVLGLLERGTGFVPEMPGRGPAASMTGRSLAVVADLAADLQPDGWRLTGTSATSGVDHRRAGSLLAQDLDTVEELSQGWDGPFKTQVAGPWTLAATVEKPRGDKVLADHGARRELAEALAEGIGTHVADLRRRVPGATELVVQVDEPALSAVARAQVPTASGYGRHRAVDRPELSAHLRLVCEAVTAAGAVPWVHSCAPDTPWDLVLGSSAGTGTGAGAQGMLLDLDVAGADDLDTLAEALESGLSVGLGIVPGLDPATVPGDAALTERVLRMLDMLGLDPAEHVEQLLLTPGCGLAGASAGWARRALELCATVADNLNRGSA